MTANNSSNSINWSDILVSLNKEPSKQMSENTTKSMYKLAADPDYEDKLIDAVLKTLEKTDPENANYKQAVIVAKQTQALARKRLEEIEAEARI